MIDRGLQFPAEPSAAGSLGRRIRYHAARWGLLLLVAGVTVLAFPSSADVSTPVFAAGEVSDRDVVTPLAFAVPKTADELTRERDARSAAVPPVYRYSPAAFDSALAAVTLFFDGLDQPGALAPDSLAAKLRTRLTDEERRYLEERVRRVALREALKGFLGRLLSAGVADAGVVLAESNPAVALQRDSTERLVPRDSVVTFADLVAQAEAVHLGRRGALGERLFRKLAAEFYRPTLVPDPAATRTRQADIRAGVDSVRDRLHVGERVVAAGEVVTAAVHDRLLALRQALQRHQERHQLSRRILAPVLYNGIVLAVFWLLVALYRRETYAELREMGFLAGLFLIVILLSAALGRMFPERPELMPIPFAAMLVTMLYNGRLAVIAALTLAILLGGQWDLADNHVLFFGLVGGVVAALGVRRVRRRNHLFATVGLTAGAYALAAVTLGLLQGWTTSAVVVSALSGGVTALGSASVALLLLPVAEGVTRITTDLTLLELSDPSRRLLRRLAVEAPGTWAHSLMMANLCEAACEAIGANGLLARVGCYYHDLGKLKKPQYFVENQGYGGNPHDKLKPAQSAQIIRNHVRDGLELASEEGLPDALKAFIPEHHGTTQIEYFLDRARDRDPTTPPDADAFRYPGPKPQRAETAIAMLADSAEAAVRVLEEPTAERVREAVDHLVNQKLAAGQLDEAPVTLRDLDRIKDAFVRVMAGVYHNRIEYPSASGGITAGFRGTCAP